MLHAAASPEPKNWEGYHAPLHPELEQLVKSAE